MFVSRVFRTFSVAKDTCLKQLHLEQGGKLVDFAGKLR
jgi:aminomethyltransferase